MPSNNFVLLRGGGDLASGVALRLHRVGIRVVITELAQPLAVRRAVSFSEAVYAGSHSVEGVRARLIEAEQLPAWNEADEIPVIIDSDASILAKSQFTNTQFPVVVDARLTKQPPSPLPIQVPLHIGLGPGFTAGSDCHAVIETRRSHTLGRVIWHGTTHPDSGEPEGDPRRVLRAPAAGVLIGKKQIGEHVEAGEVVAVIRTNVTLSETKGLKQHNADSSPTAQSDIKVISPFAGVLRGLIHDGLHVPKGLKVGDVDARDDPHACFLVSDKSLAIGGGVLEAMLSKKEMRERLYSSSVNLNRNPEGMAGL
jgi:xanthine dehydrogenase accessory factor